MENEILKHLSQQYCIQDINLNFTNTLHVYKMTRQYPVRKSAFYMFIASEKLCAIDILKDVEILLESVQKPESILCVLPYGQQTADNEPMMLFNEKYRSFVHFLYCDNSTCKYDTDFYYYGAKEIKIAMKCIWQALMK